MYFSILRWCVALGSGLLLFCIPASAEQIFERPVPAGGGPTEILCTIGILDIDEISDTNQNFTANVFMRASWMDLREAHGGESPVLKGLDEVWHPHLLFLNKQWAQSSLGDTVVISSNGLVTYRQQFWGNFSQPLELHDYPFDSQDLELRIVSAGPETFGDLKMLANPDDPPFVLEDHSVADWKLTGYSVAGEPFFLPSGEAASSFALTFGATRLYRHYLIKGLAPLLMIVVLSWVVFWLDPENGAQLGVAITSFLTVIAYHIALSAKLPKISYLTRFDIFVFGVTFLVFLAMLEVVLTTRLVKTERIAGALRLDCVCRVAFPAGLVLLSAYAFWWF